MVKIQQNSRTGQHSISLPEELMKLKGWKKGLDMEFAENSKEEIIIKKKEKERVYG